MTCQLVTSEERQEILESVAELFKTTVLFEPNGPDTWNKFIDLGNNLLNSDNRIMRHKIVCDESINQMNIDNGSQKHLCQADIVIYFRGDNQPFQRSLRIEAASEQSNPN